MMEKFKSRKFILAIFFSVMGVIALFTGYIDQGSFIALTTIVLGLYNGTNYLSKKQQVDNQ